MYLNYGLPFFGNRSNMITDIYSLCKISPNQFNCLFDPFTGSNSITQFMASKNIAKKYYCNDRSNIIYQLLTEIKNQPKRLISIMNKNISDIHNNNAYEKLKIIFNQEQIDQQTKCALFFILLLFTENHMPKFDKLGNFVSNYSCNTSEESAIEIIKKMADVLSSNNIEISNKNFTNFLASIRHDDLVVFDPPYPDLNSSNSGTKIYEQFSKQSTISLHQQLCKQIEICLKKSVPFILFYGTGYTDEYFILKNHKQMHHLIRFDTHSQFGAYFEHIYISKKLDINLNRLPKNFAVYNSVHTA